MLAVAKCCLMAILRSESSPASLLPGFFLPYEAVLIGNSNPPVLPSTKLTEVPRESAPVAWEKGRGWQPDRLDFGVTPNQDVVILRIEAGSSLFCFDHSR